MTEQRKNQIEDLTLSILGKYQAEQCPHIAMSEIMSGESIRYKEIKNVETTFLGMYCVFNEKKKIRVNADIISNGRKNFTIAHELGHYFLKHDLKEIIADTEDTIFGKSINEQEQEANYFASRFLMPKKIALKKFAELLVELEMTQYIPLYVDKQACNYVPWKIISNNLEHQFGVSNEALRYRLEELHILKYAIK